MKITNFFKSLGTGLYNSVKRFPLTIAFTTAIAVIAMIMLHNQNNFTESTMENLTRICMGLGLAALFTLCTKLKCERFEFADKSTIWALYLVCVGFSYLYYSYFLPDLKMVSIVRYSAVMIALGLTFLFIPYIRNKNIFELYVVKLFVRALITVLYSGVLFLGIAAILFTIDELLGISINDKLYLDVWIGIVGVFASCFFLSGVPLYSEEFELSEYPKPIKILLLYIVMPVISIYTAILYLYFVKIIVFTTWPVGLVAHLVLWYSLISTGVLFLIAPFEEENKWVRTFRFWFIKLNIPLLLMMFVSLWIRIKEYGITENRYYVAIAGLWVLGIMIYMNIAKARKNIVIPVSIAIIAVLSVFGPWSSFNVSVMSQNARLEGILQSNSMLKDGKAAKPTAEIAQKDKTEISGVLSYFSRAHGLSDVRCLPSGFTMDKMKDTFGFSSETIYPMSSKYFSYMLDTSVGAIDTSGYEYFLTNEFTAKSDKNPYLKYNTDTQQLTVLIGNKTIYQKNFSAYTKDLYKQYGDSKFSPGKTAKLVFDDQSQDAKVRIVFKNVSGRNDETDNLKIDYAEFYVFVNILN